MEILKIVLLLLGICIWSCKAIVNLTWTAEKDMLTLKCKTRPLIWSVQFLSPAGKEIAYCQIPFPSPNCYTTDESYITVKQDTTTNTTILTYKGISSSLNGQWKCIYGNNVDLDVVNVTIRVKDTSMDDRKDENCFEEFYAWTMIGFTMVIVLYNISVLLTKKVTGGCIYGRAVFQCDCCPVLISKRNKKLIITIVITFTVPVFPVCVGFITNDCKYKEYFIIYGIFEALVMLIFFYHIVTPRNLKECQNKEIENEDKVNQTKEDFVEAKVKKAKTEQYDQENEKDKSQKQAEREGLVEDSKESN